MLDHLQPNNPHDPPVRNGVLAALSADAFERLKPRLERVPLRLHEQILGSDTSERYVYFPESGMVAWITRLADGSAIEVALVGRRGLISVMAALGAGVGAIDAIAVVEMEGTALRIRTDDLVREVNSNPTLQAAIVRFLQAILVQVSQSVACVGHHTLRQRLAGWLLGVHDDAPSDEITLSHEHLAMLLGVQRPGVTLALGEFRDAGLIATGHGRIAIVDRKGLEAAACECYAAVKAEYERLLA